MRFCPNSTNRVFDPSGLETPPTIYEIGCTNQDNLVLEELYHKSGLLNPHILSKSLRKFP